MIMMTASSQEALQQLYDAEFGARADVMQSAETSLAARKAVRDSPADVSAVAAFDAIVDKEEDPGKRLRFAALVADITNPRVAGNESNSVLRFCLFVAASSAFSRTLADEGPLEIFETISQHPDSFCQSPFVASLSLQYLNAMSQRHPEPGQRQAALTAARYIMLNMPRVRMAK